MNRSLRRALLALVAVIALAVSVAACGSSDKKSDNSSSSSSGGGGGGGQLIKADPANKGKKLTVGSKNFAEQFILGEIYSQALQAAGFSIKKQLDLGSEQIAYKAVKSGTVDMYPEYSGTALTSFYHVTTDKVPRDKQAAFDLLKKDAAADKITTLPQTPFQNTFVISSTKKTAAALGNPKTISELAAKAGSGKSISGFPECKTRTDCLVGLKNVYHWTPKFVSSQGKFDDLDKGQADFTFGFGTDGELSLDKYATYQDDKKLFPPYYITLMTRNDAVQKLGPAGQAVIQQVQKPLTEQVMQELNSRVTIDKQEPQKVAHDYLKESGFIK